MVSTGFRRSSLTIGFRSKFFFSRRHTSFLIDHHVLFYSPANTSARGTDTYDVLKDVIVVANVSGVIAKVRVETASRGRVRQFVVAQMPFAHGPRRVPQFLEVFR